MNRTFAIVIFIAIALLIGLTVALGILRSNTQSPEQASTTEVVIPTSTPNSQTTVPAQTSLNQTISTTTHMVNSNDDMLLGSTDRTAIENVVKKLPIDSDLLKIEYSELLDTFYIQNNAINQTQVRKFIEENNLSNLYKTYPEFFKFTDKYPGDVLDEDEEVYAIENGLGETLPEDSPTNSTGNEKQIDIMKKLSSILFGASKHVPQPSIAPSQPTHPPTISGETNSVNCNNIVSNERIICAALKYTGIRYGFVYNPTESIKRWGVKSRGTYGRPPAEWIATRTPEGPTDFLVCSSYTDLAIYVAFGFYKYHLSHTYLDDKQNFREVPVNSTLPGDLVIKGTAAAGDGHVAILITRYANGSMKTLESTSAKSGRSGYFNRKPGSFTRAVRYIGPGSTE